MNISTITKTIAIVPELVRSTAHYVQDIYPIMLAQVGASPEELINLLNDVMSSEDDDDCDGENCNHHTPLTLWEAGRRGLELVTIIRARDEFPTDFREVVQTALNDVDSPQHAADIIMALANMLANTIDEEDVEQFAEMFLKLEVRAS